MKGTVSEKGQVTIPKALRDSLALKPGTQLDFVEEEGKLVARRVQGRDPLESLVGLLPRLDVTAALRAARGPHWRAGLDARRRGHRSR